ncbi:UDP-N-acetylmuramate dehydrogenase [Idiomarina baltica]|uniref:UDP-N-acetylenolpyruvoylglucosamine reductase n=1 Tax=Idiomarina baltica OS145 TaxID=314276 RepID=A0ABM9WLQ8_9GAMM|nr:UDP-N-acetylmuramate dehydrogenase [Idiomarina baltica]EAQ31900.1 UDP-N-acetylmuramate dehydrogenase [Idiomarina baltica OS145]
MDRIVTKDMVQYVESICPNTTFVDEELSKISRWKTGGNADLIIKPKSLKNLSNLVAGFKKQQVEYIIIGETSNLLFDDKGLRVPCIQIDSAFNNIKLTSTGVIVESGYWVPKLSRFLMLNNFTGAEHICGIPGTIGGLVYMNGGSMRRSIGDNVIKVTSLTKNGDIVTRSKSECFFNYRESIFQNISEIIVEVEFEFDKIDDRAEVRRKMLHILKDRRNKFPRKLPNCGSVFKSNPKMYEKYGPPGKVIEDLCFKGFSIGNSRVSEQHANFITHNGKGKSSEIRDLIRLVHVTAFEKLGLKMDIEVSSLDEYGRKINFV